ncbi:MAG: glycosyltransferase [Patescibacteria group bacterium]
MKPTLSVILPAYKQEKTIVSNIKRLKKSLDLLKIPYEIVCVADGRVDKTQRILRKAKIANVLSLGYEQNRGKGHAVRYGMTQAKGEIVGFVDSGDLDYTVLPLLLEHMNWYDADIMIASKKHPASKVYYPWQRRIISSVYQLMVRMLFGLNVRDTQVGMKFFRREVIEKVLPRILVKEFAFDIEMLAVAHHLGFIKIYEAPVKLKLDFSNNSSVVSKGFSKMVIGMIVDTISVFYRLKILHYYDDANKKNWQPNMYLEW